MKLSFSKIFSLFLIFIVILQSFTLFFLHNKYEKLQNKPVEIFQNNEDKVKHIEEIIKISNLSERENIEAINKKQKNVSEIEIAGWIPDWDIPNGLESVKSTGSFSNISPVWFWPNEDGSLKLTSYTNNLEFINYIKSNNIELTPTISLFDESTLSQILNNPENLDRHIEEIVNQVVLNDYDGIDLDYESILLEDKELFFDFLERLSLDLAQRNKKFIFTVMPKWGEEVVYMSLPQTRIVQDYKRIAELVDEFRIMTYEFSARNGIEIGPIAPVEWMEDTLKYAIYAGVPREKIMLGIHTYAYDYPKKELIKELEYKTLYQPTGDGENAIAYFPQKVQSINFENTYFNEDWGEAIGEYKKDEKERIVIFPNQESIDIRKQLAADYGIKGVVYWRVGDEGVLEY